MSGIIPSILSYPYMDPGWDHTENEDKLLLAHTLGMGQDMHTDMSINSVSMIRCYSAINVCGGGDGSISLSGQHKNHLLSILINNYNLLFGLSPTPFQFFFLLYYIQLNCLYSFICKISNFCNSNCTSKCKCDCKCDPGCAKNTICLCLCECTTSNSVNGCCICICKHKDCNSNPKCICICICVCKKGENCCCQPGQTHTCNKCLIKVDLSTLRNDTWRIFCHLRCIRWYIQIIDKKCCYCSCCVNGRCDGSCCEPCQSITEYYKSIISRIHLIESLFKRVGQKILELTKMNYSLSFYSEIANSCKSCDCCNKIKNLIDYIEKAGQYYSSFASVIGDIRMLVDYKTFCPQANEIIEKLKMSAKPLLNKLIEINSQILINVDLTRISDELLVVVYSHYGIFQCFLAMYILLQSSSKIYSILYTIRRSDICGCVYKFETNDNNFCKILDFYKIIYNSCDKFDGLKKLFIVNDGNHMCLCLVIKYVLYPSLIKSFFYMRGIYYEGLSKITREFLSDNYIFFNTKNTIKIIFFTFDLIYKISMFIESRLPIVKSWCFCQPQDAIYYSYMISIILFISSLIENIWSMDHLSIVSAIDCVSSLLAEYQSIHVYTNYGSGQSMFKTFQNFMIFSHFGSSTKLCLNDLYMELDIKKSNILINSSVKSYYKSVNSILTIGIPLPLFNIVLYKLSSVSFFLMNHKDKSLGYIKHSNNITTVIYRKSLCQKQTNQICCKIGVCKICPIAKIKINCLWISLKRIEVVLSNVIGNILLFHLKVDIGRSRDFITNLCVGFGEVYTIMLKNPLINSDHVLRSYGNTGITNVETRNWGYDTKYEHDVSTDKGFTRGYECLNLLSDPRYTFSHLSIFLHNYPYLCNMNM